MSPNVIKLLADALLEFAEKLQRLAGEGEPDNGQPEPQTAPEQPAPTAEQPQAEKPAINEADVRMALAAKAREGFTDEAKAIIAKYGAAMVSELDPAHYAAVIKEAGAIK